MNFLRFALLMWCGLSVSACEGLAYSVKNAERTINRKIIGTSDKYNPQSADARRPIPSSYCYKTLHDIICYRDPQPGAGERLIGYQEPLTTDGQEVTANAAAVVQPVYSQPLPVNSTPHPQYPLNSRPASADIGQPVFVGAGPQVASDRGVSNFSDKPHNLMEAPN